MLVDPVRSLKNEPHGMYWGPAFGPAYLPDERWDTLAAELGQTVHRLCPRMRR